MLKNDTKIKSFHHHHNAPIGFFDSGFGGMSILREFVKEFPNERFIYIADNFHFPYGIKTKEEIISYSLSVCKFLIDEGVKYIVVACGTATSCALEVLNNTFDIPIFGVIEPTATAAAKATINKKIGVLATKATINLGLFEKNIINFDETINVTNVIGTELVKMAEDNIADSLVYGCSHVDNIAGLQGQNSLINHHNIDIVKDACVPFEKNNVDTIILGCTHFPLLLPIFKLVLDKNIIVIEPGRALVDDVKSKLNNSIIDRGNYYSNVDNSSNVKQQHECSVNKCLSESKFYTTGKDIDKFKNVTKHIFNKDLSNFYQINI